MRQYLGRRVLVRIGDNDAPRMTCVHMISPNGKYVRLDGQGALDEVIGWVPLDSVEVLDDLQGEHEPLVALVRRSYEGKL